MEEATRHAYPAPSATTALATAPLSERRSSSQRVEWDVELPRPGVLVVSESAYPGWEATVDDRPAAWLRANYVLRAGGAAPRAPSRPLRVQAPGRSLWGAWLSIAGLLGIFGLLAARGGGPPRRVKAPS